MNIVAELPSLRRYALSLTRSEAEADDLVHDTLVRAYEKRATYDTSRNLRVWLFAILHNTFIDRTRKNRSDLSRRETVSNMRPANLAAQQDDAVRLTQITRAFAGLPEEQRAVLHLVAIEGLSYQATAEALAIPIGTVMSRLGRARAALRAWEEGQSQSSAPRGATLRLVGGQDDEPA